MAARTLLQFYNDPPTGQVVIGANEFGSRNTASMPPNLVQNPRGLPRPIINDPRLCHKLLRFANNHLAGSSNPPTFFDDLHGLIGRALSRALLGNETINMDAFAQIMTYVTEFVLAADGAIVHVASCTNQGGIRPNRKIQRDGVDRVIVECKSVAAYDEHIDTIQEMGTGQGEELIASTHEAGGRSIIPKG
jgi:hypothetical protein